MVAGTRQLHRRHVSALARALTSEVSTSIIGGAPAELSDAAAHAVEGLDTNSDLARFLLVDGDPGSEADSSVNARGVRTGGAESMGIFCSDAYVLALEPLAVRTERIIMLAEAYAIFGGLFLGGTWVLYEWGKPPEASESVVDVMFEVVMALAICTNIFLALWSSVLWTTAIVYGSREDFVLETRKYLAFCNSLLLTTMVFVSIGILLAMFQSLEQRGGGYGLVLVAPLVLYILFRGITHADELLLTVSPLTMFHWPRWVQGLWYPRARCSPSRKAMFTERLKERAMAEAEKLRSKAQHGDDAGMDAQGGGRRDRRGTGVGAVLRDAASRLGRADGDLSACASRLEDDWFDDARQLRGKGVDFLSRYMPYRLADEVHRIVEGPLEVMEAAEAIEEEDDEGEGSTP